jgi:lipoate-protein ligase A
MQFLDLTLPTPAENLAMDEALLEEAECGGLGETLRLWEPAAPFVVVGRSSRVATEVKMSACRADDVPVLRRCSGGAAIVTGPGCLMYAVVLSHAERPALWAVDQAHCFVLCVVKIALERISSEVEIRGMSDLARGPRKFSGNSLRYKRSHLLYHGTILYEFPLAMIGRYLGSPPRQPEYRAGRDHREFVANFPGEASRIRSSLRDAWSAREPLNTWPSQRTAQLVADRYSQASWNLRL